MAFYQPRGGLFIPDLMGMRQGLFDIAVFGKPGTGPLMELNDLLRVEPLLELAFQQRLKQVVIAKPFALIVQGDDKQIGVFQQLHKFAAIQAAST